MCFLQTCPDRLWSCRVQPRSPLPRSASSAGPNLPDGQKNWSMYLTSARGGKAKGVTALEHPVRWKIGWAPEGDIHDHSKASWIHQLPGSAWVSFSNTKGKWLINVSATGRKLEVMKEAGRTGCDPQSGPIQHICSTGVFSPHDFFGPYASSATTEQQQGCVQEQWLQTPNIFYVAAVSRPHQLTSQPRLADTALSQARMRNSLLVLIKFMFSCLLFFLCFWNWCYYATKHKFICFCILSLHLLSLPATSIPPVPPSGINSGTEVPIAISLPHFLFIEFNTSSLFSFLISTDTINTMNSTTHRSTCCLLLHFIFVLTTTQCFPATQLSSCPMEQINWPLRISNSFWKEGGKRGLKGLQVFLKFSGCCHVMLRIQKWSHNKEWR